MHRNFCFFVLYVIWRTLLLSYADAANCNDACHKTVPGKINIHLVPHTHDDVGWLKTVDQYYYGSSKRYTGVGVQYIIDSVVAELEKNPDRRFVYVESSFFWRWWGHQNDLVKRNVRNLVDQGRLQFLHGGWCMSDEATPHYSALIDQMTLGLKFLNDTFGECGRPNAAWQIDPFGHSSEVAIEFAEMGFDGVFFGRIDYEDHELRKRERNMEFVWRPDTSLGEAGNLFTTVLYDLYTPPPGFCFDIYCNDEPIMSDKKLHGYNVDAKVNQFIQQMEKYSNPYKTNHVIVTMGSDFTYSVASAWYTNIDLLIKFVNAKSEKYHLLYSTPSCYLQAINTANTTWPLKDNDDFFPYGSDRHSYWTGYFTSRPTFKRMVYLTNNILQVTKQLATTLKNESALAEEEFMFKTSLGIAQHHDAVSGTEKQHVTNDYALYLYEGLEYGEQILNYVFQEIYGPKYPQDHRFCILRNISECSVSEDNERFVITIVNPLSKSISVPVTFPLKDGFRYQIYSQNGVAIAQDVIPIPVDFPDIPGRRSNATHDLTFIAQNIPPVGSINFYIERIATDNPELATPVDQHEDSEHDNIIVLDNGLVKLTFNKADGLLRNITKDGVTSPFSQNFFSYRAMKGLNYDVDNRASGAYIFRPVEKDHPLVISSVATITGQYRGKNVFEVHQSFTPWLSQVVRLYKNSSDIEFEWLINSIPIVDWNGVELVTKYSTNIDSNDKFYTDSNGRRWIERIRNNRKYWNLTTKYEPISANYYPITTSMHIRDDKKQMTVIVDRPEGCTSMKSGELEIMLHRRLLYDDDKGVGEPLDEMAFGKALSVRGKHIVQLNTVTDASAAHRFKVVESTYQPIPTFAATALKLEEWVNNFNKNISLLNVELPINVHLLTFERWREGQILLRLEHLFENNEDDNYSRPVSLNIKKIFSHLKVKAYEELTLAANRELDQLNRMKWRYKSTEQTNTLRRRAVDDVVTLKPMQIKTFLLYT